jgi:tetratricopeptide (TPR) repeat protein
MDKFFLILIFLFLQGIVAKAEIADSTAARKLFYQSSNETEKILAAFYMVDDGIAYDMFDSCQVWLSRINFILENKAYNQYHYFASIRQAEVYYFSDLNKLGLQQSKHALQIASSLKDSILMADAYNFSGLFYTNLKDFANAQQQYQQALLYAKLPPYSDAYLFVSQPYHIYANLGELFDKMGQYNESILQLKKSLLLCNSTNNNRAKGLNAQSISFVYHKLHNADSALFYYQLSEQQLNITPEKNADVQLWRYWNKAVLDTANNQWQAAEQMFKNGIAYANKVGNINSKFVIDFLKASIPVLAHNQSHASLSEVYQLIAQTTFVYQTNTSKQCEFIMGFNNQLQMQQQELLRKKRIQNNIIAAVIGLMVLLFFWFRNKLQQNKLLGQAKQQQAVEAEKQHLLDELKDAMGGGLSTLRISSDLLSNNQIEDADKHKLFDNVRSVSKTMTHKLNTIIWALEPNENTLGHALEFLKQQIEFIQYPENPIVVKIDDSVNAHLQLSINSRERKTMIQSVLYVIQTIQTSTNKNSLGLNIYFKTNLVATFIQENMQLLEPSDGIKMLVMNNSLALKNMENGVEVVFVNI